MKTPKMIIAGINSNRDPSGMQNPINKITKNIFLLKADLKDSRKVVSVCMNVLNKKLLTEHMAMVIIIAPIKF
jgi:hypothetical protein